MHYYQVVRITLILFALLWLVPVGLMAESPKKLPGIIRVVKVIGIVKAFEDGGDLVAQLNTGDTLTQGFIIETDVGSSVVLLFGNGSTIFVDQSTRINIKEFIQEPYKSEVSYLNQLQAEPSVSQTSLYLDRGKIIGSVRKLNIRRGSSFDMESSVGIAGIRGTQFQYSVDQTFSGFPMGSFTVVNGDGFLIPLGDDDKESLYLVSEGNTIVSNLEFRKNTLSPASTNIIETIEDISTEATNAFEDFPAENFEPGSSGVNLSQPLDTTTSPDTGNAPDSANDASSQQTTGDGTSADGSDARTLDGQGQAGSDSTTTTDPASDSTGDIDPGLLQDGSSGGVAPAPPAVTPSGGTP